MNTLSLFRLFYVLFFAALVLAAPAHAEGIPSTTTSAYGDTSEPVSTATLESPAAVRELVSRLDDDAVRQLLIERLDAVATEASSAQEGGAVVASLLSGLRSFVETAKENLGAFNTVPTLWSRAQADFDRSIQSVGLGRFVVTLFIALGVSVLAERLVARLFRRRKQALFDEIGYTLGSVLRIIYSRLCIDILGVLAFLGAGHAVWASLYNRGLLLQIGDSTLTITASVWIGYVVMRFLFSPNTDGMRFCETSPERARWIIWSFAGLAGLIVAVHHTVFVLSIANRNHGGLNAVGPYAFPVNLAMYAFVMLVIWLNRRALTDVLLENQNRIKTFIGGEMSEEARRFARSWPVIAMVLVALKYALVQIVINTTDLALYSTAAVYLTFFVILLWPAFDANVNLIVALGTRASDEQSGKAAEAHILMQRGLLRVGRVFLIGIVITSLAIMWGFDFRGLAEAGLGVLAAGRVLELLIIFLMAYVAWEIVNIWARRTLSAETGNSESGDDGGGDMGGVGLSRTATLIPIIEKTSKALIVLVAVFVSLDAIGINIAPLLAGAGVVGLAVGFGAQTLVKDIVSGLFFLADDAFRVAEYIDVGGTMGTVEKISLRSLRLRHHRGLVHTIPYGEIPKLTNYSRDWVIMKLRFRVPFETDINKVKKIFKRIGQEMLEHPEIGGDFLQPFKSQGVAEMDDDAIVVRGKFMAKPGRQFMIRKEVYVRVQQAFDEAGIPFARKQVMVHIPGLDGKPESLNRDDAHRVAAAAADATTRPTLGEDNSPKS